MLCYIERLKILKHIKGTFLSLQLLTKYTSLYISTVI